jgi:hypothetical protein
MILDFEENNVSRVPIAVNTGSPKLPADFVPLERFEVEILLIEEAPPTLFPRHQNSEQSLWSILI